MTKSPADDGTDLTADAKVDEILAAEPTLLELTLAPLRGKRRWSFLCAMPAGVAFLTVGFFSLWKFLNAESAPLLIQWALAFVCCMWAVSMMKIWYWMEMQAASLTRRINQLELQVSRLVRKGESSH